MKKEFKIGLVIGVLVLIAVVLYFATRKDNSVENRATVQMEPNLPVIDINAPPAFDSNSARPLPGAAADANTSLTKSHASKLTSGGSAGESTVFEQTEPIKTDRFYVVHKGDTLSSISQKFYGNSKGISKILDANKTAIKNKNNLKVGTKLSIPE